MSRYGQGNARAKLRARAFSRRCAEHVAVTDERDIGIKPGVAKVLGFDGEELEGPPEHDSAWCEAGFGCPRCVAAERQVG